MDLPRPVGATALKIGPLGLGVAPLGNLYTPVTDEEAYSTLEAARRNHIAWFDVAPLYGLGLAEERLGQFLKRAGAKDFVLSTKVGRVLDPLEGGSSHPQFVSTPAKMPVFDYTESGIERSYEESLARLGQARVQLLLLHDIDRATHLFTHRQVARQIFDEALPALNRLKREGRVDAIGLGINHWEVGYEVLASADVDCVLLAGRYTLLDQTGFTSGYLDACQRRGVSVLAGGVLNSGFLAGGSTYDYQAAKQELLQRRDELSALCERYDVALPAVAVQFTAAHPAIISTLIGSRSPAEIEASLSWNRTRIAPDLWAELKDRNLIPRDAPCPH